MKKIFLILILLFINPIHSSNMFVLTTTKTLSSMNSFFKRRFLRQLNFTDDYSINRIQTLDVSYNTIKETSSK
jgi:hypothetical protein